MDARLLYTFAALLTLTNAETETGLSCASNEECESKCCQAALCHEEDSCEVAGNDAFAVAMYWIFLIGGVCCGMLCVYSIF